MLRYARRRLLSAAIVVLAVAIATFLILHVEPGDPARAVLGEHATPAAVQTLRHQWGLDASLGSQFERYLADIARGNLGRSYLEQTSTTSLIQARIAVTAALVGMATLFSILITVPLAALAAARKERLPDHLVRGLSVTGLGLPAFWFGIVLIELFALRVHLFPVGGWGTSFLSHVRGLILPALTASFAIAPILIRSLRVGMIEVIDADFVATLRAKGLSEARVLGHVARNAILPALNLLGINIAFLIGSTVVIERVFNLSGLGSLLLSSISERDFPVVQALTLVLATAVVLINLLTDLLAARLDPRIRLG